MNNDEAHSESLRQVAVLSPCSCHTVFTSKWPTQVRHVRDMCKEVYAKAANLSMKDITY